MEFFLEARNWTTQDSLSFLCQLLPLVRKELGVGRRKDKE